MKYFIYDILPSYEELNIAYKYRRTVQYSTLQSGYE